MSTVVVTGLVMNGDKQDEDVPGGMLRLQAVRTLCQMNPSQALNVRTLCVEQCRMPGLAIYLTLDAGKANAGGMGGSSLCGGEGGDVVSYVTGLLLSPNQPQRSWFAQFVKSGQRRKYDQPASALVALRTDLSERLRNFLLFNSNDTLPDSQVIHATALLRLYCALKSLANLKASGVSSSFGAMLLLMAIHFHVQQLSAIIELVSAALGMKVITRASSLGRIKYIFTHDVFTEQVVTAHAVKVPVTTGLNANIPGFLPVHCVYHQLKSRMFTKHKVPIKDWIYNQICASSTPLHPVMPQLIEVYVNSIILSSNKGGMSDHFNEPISEEEIMAVFSQSIFTEKNSGKCHEKHQKPGQRRGALRGNQLRRFAVRGKAALTPPTTSTSKTSHLSSQTSPTTW
ncbi:Integrator complex subunit 2 [Portunus trituberculatus]|uniref:Integrator complex subunit 2 n=1 Tax=Portunus trituberculatus TaxID=210409 RepID=A0A5B7D6H1_PORTR|nr:Integrator complex subunit 2 [Portunus trituberculatus]